VEKIQSPLAPPAIGPYSQAIRANGMIYCSGQIPLNTQAEVVGGDVTTQAHQVMQNLKAVLEEAGSSLSHVVMANCYLADLADFADFNQVYGQYFSEPYPARVTFQVARLPRDVRVEVAVIALA
jgi:2-iminobutanoate/2-iminopropanoate deaminase